MSLDTVPYILLAALGVFLSSISQVMLKKEAMKKHTSTLREYANPLVICAYALMLLTTLMLVISFRGIPLSMGPVIEATSYLYVTVFGVIIFGERLGKKKVFALALIVLGVCIYAFGL